MRYVIGIDLGTSGTKTVLFDENGVTIASALVEYPLYQPQNGWAEQNPSEWWDGVVRGLKVILEKYGSDMDHVVRVDQRSESQYARHSRACALR